MTNLFRSLVFVPGNNPRFLEKAKSLSGDIVCFDLEDSVPDKEKQNARTLISKKLKERKDFQTSSLSELILLSLVKFLLI